MCHSYSKPKVWRFFETRYIYLLLGRLLKEELHYQIAVSQSNKRNLDY